MNNIEKKLLVEARSYGPAMIAIDVTYACNYRCMHCFNKSGKPMEDELSDYEFIKIISEIKNIRPISLCFCGGEPFLRYELIKESCNILKDSVGSINMVTNGYLADRKKLIELTENGLSIIQVSLDGVNSFQHDSFRGIMGAFEKAINTIKNSVDAGLQVSVALTPNKLNFRCIDEYIALCFELGVKNLRSMPWIPMGRGEKNQLLMLNSDEYVLFQLKLAKSKLIYDKKGMRIEWGDPLDHLYRMPANYSANIKTFQMDITANGKVKISTYLPIFAGDLKIDSIKSCWARGYNKIWGNKKVLDQIKNIVDVYDLSNVSKSKIINL